MTVIRAIYTRPAALQDVTTREGEAEELCN